MDHCIRVGSFSSRMSSSHWKTRSFGRARVSNSIEKKPAFTSRDMFGCFLAFLKLFIIAAPLLIMPMQESEIVCCGLKVKSPDFILAWKVVGSYLLVRDYIRVVFRNSNF